jgi:hypothetical protein
MRAAVVHGFGQPLVLEERPVLCGQAKARLVLEP